MHGFTTYRFDQFSQTTAPVLVHAKSVPQNSKAVFGLRRLISVETLSLACGSKRTARLARLQFLGYTF